MSLFLQQLDGCRKPDVYGDREGGVWNAYLRVQGVSALFDQLSRRDGVTILEPLCHQPYGQTEFVVQDPNGYAIVFAEREMAVHPLATTTQPLVAFVSFYRDDVQVFETEPMAIVDGLDARSKAVPVRLTVPLAAVPPGRYDCQVTVLEPTGQKAAFWRAPVVIVR